MGAFFLTISMLLVLANMLAASVSLCAYLVTRRPSLIARLVAFVAYLCESMVIIYEEYLSPMTTSKVTMGDPGTVEDLWLKLATSTALVAAVWYLMCRLYRRDTPRMLAAVPSVVLAAQIAITVAPLGFDSGKVGFYLVRDAFFITCFARLGASALGREDDQLAQKARGRFPLIAFALVMAICMLLADATSLDPVYQMLYGGTESAAGHVLLYYVVKRNVFEIVLICVCTTAAVRNASEILALRFSQAQPTHDEERGSELRLARFSERHALSKREQDILPELLRGDSYQKIASELFISVGTVKSHASHIYAKTRTGGRKRLIQAYWQE